MAGRPELELILLSGRLFIGAAPDEEALAFLRHRLDWPALFDRAAAEGMLGLLAFQLRRLARAYRLELPLERFVRALHGELARNLGFAAELSALRGALRARGLQAILLKGGALIETVYGGHPGLRPISDLDLLVKAADLPIIGEELKQRGFRSSSPSSTFLMREALAFDLHSELIGSAWFARKALAFHFDAEALWRDAERLDAGDPSLLVLSARHQAVHLMLHALKHSFSRLIWFIDLALVLKQLPWEEVTGGAEEAGALRVLAYALFGLRGLMRLEVPDKILMRLPPLNGIERAFLGRVVNRQPLETSGELVVAYSIPGLAGKLAYLLELVFPRREVLVRHYPSTPAWLLYPHRLMRVAALGFQDGKAFFRR